MSLTPLYGLRKFDTGEPARNTGVIVNQHADTLETALAARGVPPTDLQALVAAGWFSDTGQKNVTGAGGLGVTVGSGWTLTGVQARKRAGVLYMWGAPSKATWTNGETVLTMPTGYRPAVDTEWLARTGSTYQVLILEATGALRIYAANTAGALGTAFAIIARPVPVA